MKYIASIVSAFSFLISFACGESYEIKIRSNGEEIAVIDLTIDDSIAIAKVGQSTERYDLKQLRWQDDASGKWVSLAECETWAKQSMDKANKSTVSIPASIRPFIMWTINPKFKIAQTDTTLTLTSGQVDYIISGMKTESDLSNYFKYARLNAYRKAMTERKLAPFSELRAIDEMERSKLKPESVEIKIPGVPGSPTITMLITGK